MRSCPRPLSQSELGMQHRTPEFFGSAIRGKPRPRLASWVGLDPWGRSGSEAQKAVWANMEKEDRE
jgi:hypothetical protein